MFTISASAIETINGIMAQYEENLRNHAEMLQTCLQANYFFDQNQMDALSEANSRFIAAQNVRSALNSYEVHKDADRLFTDFMKRYDLAQSIAEVRAYSLIRGILFTI